MSRFIENEAAPIVSTLLRQGFIPDYSEALGIIDQSELRTGGDAKWALSATGLGVASSCGILALSGVTAPILIPIGAALGCLAVAWNSRQTEIDRIKESEFLGQFPEVLTLIESKDAAGATEAHIAAAYEQTFKAYRYGDLDSIERFLTPPTESPAVPPTEYAGTPAHQQAAPYQQAQIGGESAIAVLERTMAKPTTIGLPAALRSVTVDQPYSTFIIGMSGAGKDIALYSVMTALKQRYPTALYVGIDGKNHAGELPLWPDNLYDRTIHISMLDRVADYHRGLLGLLKQACEFPGMVFVAFSELNGIAGTYIAAGMKTEWGEIAHYLRYLALQGNAAGKFLLSTAQGITLDELGISTSTRANIQFLMVGNGSQFGFISSITANTSVFDRKLISDQNAFTAACSRSTALEHLPNANTDKGIGYFHTALNRWEPMPRLVNPGADRCNPVVNQPPMVPVVPVVDAAATAEAVPTVAEMDANLEAAIEIEELIDAALETLYGNPGTQYSLSKLFTNKSQRARLRDALIDVLKDAEGVEHKPKKSGAVISHYFVHPKVIN